jgi:hypothetical protein
MSVKSHIVFKQDLCQHCVGYDAKARPNSIGSAAKANKLTRHRYVGLCLHNKKFLKSDTISRNCICDKYKPFGID